MENDTHAYSLFERGWYEENGKFQTTDDECLALKEVTEKDVPAVLDFMDGIYEKLPDKSWFSMDSHENLTCYMVEDGFAFMIQKKMSGENDELAAVAVARTRGLGDENLGKYLDLDEVELEKTAHMEIVMVSEKFRGRGFQKGLMELAEDYLKRLGFHRVMGTAHPENVYSVNNFKKRGYKIIAEDMKYGGLPRYIFSKELK